MKTISNYIEFAYLFDVTNGNPNGDPDAANAPRQDYETGVGLVSDVCLKRKVRNYVEMKVAAMRQMRSMSPRAPFWTTSKGSLGCTWHKDKPSRKKARAGGEDSDENKSDEERDLTKWMCNQYYDVRMMGALMPPPSSASSIRMRPTSPASPSC